MLAFYPCHEFLHGRVFEDGLDRRKLLRELGIRENRMYLVMADSVQANGFLATLALRDEMVGVFLIIRDHALTHRAKHWLGLHVP